MSDPEWHRLCSVTDGGAEVEVMAAAQIDGIGVISQWRRDGAGLPWRVRVIDTESSEELSDFHEGEPVPPSPPQEMTMTNQNRHLNITSTGDAIAKVPDVEVAGTPDVWRLICKASSATGGWMKTTKAMNTPMGAVIQTETLEGASVSQAAVFVPGVKWTVMTDGVGCWVLMEGHQ